jgi:hypothetical protein
MGDDVSPPAAQNPSELLPWALGLQCMANATGFPNLHGKKTICTGLTPQINSNAMNVCGSVHVRLRGGPCKPTVHRTSFTSEQNDQRMVLGCLNGLCPMTEVFPGLQGHSNGSHLYHTLKSSHIQTRRARIEFECAQVTSAAAEPQLIPTCMHMGVARTTAQ